jgi:hypothetical protein
MKADFFSILVFFWLKILKILKLKIEVILEVVNHQK